MSAPISRSSSAATAQTGAASARPQVQSRRVSLKLGPFGLTYSTDQVLWTAAAAEAAASATESAASADLQAESTGQGGVAPAAQAAQTQTEAGQSARTFNQELAEAWRRQVEARAQTSGTYGPGGRSSVVDGGRGSATAEGTATDQAVEGAAQGSGNAATQAAGQTGQPSAQSAVSAPVRRVRQAITAYLACAQGFSPARPMLTAVA